MVNKPKQEAVALLLGVTGAGLVFVVIARRAPGGAA